MNDYGEQQINLEPENVEQQIELEEEPVIINQGGTQNYNELTNKPSINNVELRGDKTSEELGLADNSDITDLQEQIDAITVSSDVVDVLGTYQDLQNYDTSELGDNDIVKVLQDSTHGNAMSYYRWNKTAGQWVYVGSEGPFYTKSESDTKFQDKLVSGTNIKTINNESILGSGNIDIEGGYPEVPEAAYTLYDLIEIYSDETTLPDGIYTVTQDWFIDVPKQDTYSSDNIFANSLLYINRNNGMIGWSGPSSSMYWSNGDETFTGGVLTTIDDVNFAIDEKLGSAVVTTNTEQTISGKKTFTSNNGTIFENAGGLILKYLFSSPEFKIIPDNLGNFDIYYQNTQLARIDSSYTTLHRGFRPSRNETLDLGSSSYSWSKVYSKILANGSIEKNVVNLLTNDADLVPTYGNSFSIGSSSRLWNTLFALALHNGTTRIAISDIATKTELAGKQDTLTAGTGIAITNNVISSTLEGIDYEVDQELPATGEKGIIYLIPNGSSEQENIYDEYIWIPPLQEGESGRFEFIGTTQTDLTNYVDLTSAQTISGVKTFSNGLVSDTLDSTGTLNIKQNSNNAIQIQNANAILRRHLLPNNGNTYDIGTPTYRWNNLYLAGNLSDGTNSVTVNKIANKDNFVTLSQADYDALVTKDPDTYYFIEEE